MRPHYPRTVATIIWFGERVMLAQRLDTHTFSGYWESTGGKIDDTDQSIAKAAAREILEECGLYVPDYYLELADCILDDPTTDKCFIFRYCTHEINFQDAKNKERRKRTPWQLFTPEEAMKLKLMPGLSENILKRPLMVF